MRRTRLLIIILLSFSASSISYGQRSKVKKASKKYDNYAYVKTSEILREVAEKGYKSTDLLQKLGDSYYFNNNMEEASKWYGELVDLGETIDSEYYWRYAQALKSLERYSESDQWMEKFKASKPSDLRSQVFTSSVDYVSEMAEQEARYDAVKNLNINSKLSDFGTTVYKDQLVFASSNNDSKIYHWNEQPYLDLFSARTEGDGNYGEVSALGGSVNTKLHESSAAYMPNDSIMFFTRNNYYKKRYKEDADGVNRLQLFRAHLTADNQWEDIRPVHFNSNDYSVAHPSINKAGDLLYFVSDMPGSYGNSDLYVAAIQADGTLGAPKNLGKKINTEAVESFPFISSNGDLYFSSNGYPGLGGLDVYVIRDFETQYANNARSYEIENVGKPINSPRDDFGYYENLEKENGYFTSNRLGGKGDDDIYSFIKVEPTPCMQEIAGVVKDKNSGALLSGARVALYDDASGQVVDEVTVGSDARFSFTEVGCDMAYIVRANKPDYIGDEKHFTTPKTPQELALELNLEQDVKEIVVGTDLAPIIDIPIIYFDLDKSHIRYDAEVELQKVIAVLQQYPSMRLDVRSHTDSRASDSYNDALSSRRNKSTIRYIVEKGGIDASRLTGRGYGERELVNHCSNGVKCSEAQHQLNRRSEFIILSR